MNILVRNLGNGIKNIIINDPKTYNSLSFATLNSLLNTFKKIDQDQSTKVIILEGVGNGFLPSTIWIINFEQRLNNLRYFDLNQNLNVY